MEEKVIERKRQKVRDAWVYLWKGREISERKAEIIKEVEKIQKKNFVIEERTYYRLKYGSHNGTYTTEKSITGMGDGEISKGCRWLWLHEKDIKKAAKIFLDHTCSRAQKRLDEARVRADELNEIAEKYDLDIRIE